MDTFIAKGGRVEHISGNPELDRFSGVVLKASIAVITGKIVDMWINKAPEGSRLPFPAAVAADGNTFEIGIRGRFTGGVDTTVGMEVVVTDPDGLQRAAPAIDWTGMSPSEELNWEYNICRVDKVGEWTTVIRFLSRE